MSQWGFPTVLVNKPHSNKMRMCNDVRKLNDKTILQPYPMLNMNYLLADIGKRKCKYFSFYQIHILRIHRRHTKVHNYPQYNSVRHFRDQTII